MTVNAADAGHKGFYVSAGLLSAEHLQRIGPAVWEFLWLISHETKDLGKVLNGSPVTAARIAAELGRHEETVKVNLSRLEREGYITRGRKYAGLPYEYAVANSKKWKPEGGSENTATLPGGVAVKTLPGSPRKHCQGGSENTATNKEVDKVDRVDSKSKTNTAPDGAPVPDPLPDWMPLENWQGFVEHRRKIRKPLSPRAIQLTIRYLAELRERGQSPAAVLDQSVKNGWTGIFELKGGSTNGNGKPSMVEVIKREQAISRVRAQG